MKSRAGAYSAGRAGACWNSTRETLAKGAESDDLGLGQTGVVMAGIMGIPCHLILEVEKRDGSVHVKRVGGWLVSMVGAAPAGEAHMLQGTSGRNAGFRKGPFDAGRASARVPAPHYLVEQKE